MGDGVFLAFDTTALSTYQNGTLFLHSFLFLALQYIASVGEFENGGEFTRFDRGRSMFDVFSRPH